MRIKVLFVLVSIIYSIQLYAQNSAKNVLEVNGTLFEMNGRPFEYTGVSFFNAIFNEDFNRDSSTRKMWLQKFLDSGINVLRIWCQWDNARGFIDAGVDKTIFNSDGTIKPDYLEAIKEITNDADEKGIVILLVLFSRESWNENLRLSDSASEKGVEILAKELKPYRNLVFQIWNEFDYRTVDYAEIIKSIDPERLVTNSPGYGGFLGSKQENSILDFLSPHTSRHTDRHWEIAAKEIAYLIERYQKPVVDDEPARKGTPNFGGPKSPTLPEDHILHIYNVWKVGGYTVYHHDMFQTGYGSDAIPPSGIPAPGFSEYHDKVFNFLKNKERYLKQIRNNK
ncbi:MAG TPA: cellulase family glycosylhydrolase [Draconibacterium sp.]|nr:cellulase family glycosylhydrolase [Draconibacterium sp.]